MLSNYGPTLIDSRFRRTLDEPRWLVIGQIGSALYAAVITYRTQRVRLISVRRARKEEVAFYES